jgi:hypothetical protein
MSSNSQLPFLSQLNDPGATGLQKFGESFFQIEGTRFGRTFTLIPGGATCQETPSQNNGIGLRNILRVIGTITIVPMIFALICKLSHRGTKKFTIITNPQGVAAAVNNVANPVVRSADVEAHVELSALESVCKKMKVGPQKKKAALFRQAMSRLKENGAEPSLEMIQMSDAKKKEFKTPRHFNEIPQLNEDSVPKTTPNFYHYVTSNDSEVVWVDFANRVLGGGCFGAGFVQEEIMVAEMPEFANLIAENLDDTGRCSILTREGKESPGKGNPTPVLIKGVHRVQAVDGRQFYGHKLNAFDEKKICRDTKELYPPQKVNILAIAAPRLADNDKETQTAKLVAKDIYNTLVAGFVHAKDHNESGNPLEIHSGRIGCGVFNNDPNLVYLLHIAAAQQVGDINLVMHGYNDQDAARLNNIWKKEICNRAFNTVEEMVEHIARICSI